MKLKFSVGLLLALVLIGTVTYADQSKTDYRAESQEEVYMRSNDAQNAGYKYEGLQNVSGHLHDAADRASDYAAETYDSLKAKLANLYEDASTTWGHWQAALKAKWNKATDKVADKKDDWESSLKNSFQETLDDLKYYQKSLTDSVKSHTPDVPKEFSRLLNDFKDNYENSKTHTKKWFDSWSSNTKDTVEKGADTAKEKGWQVCEEAKAKYYQSRSKIRKYIDYLSGKISKEEYEASSKIQQGAEHAKGTLKDMAGTASDYAAHTYENVKDKLTGLYDDAASTWTDWKGRFAEKWARFTESELDHEAREHEEFQKGIQDFQRYLEVYEETAKGFSPGMRGRISHLIDDVKEKFTKYKDLAKAKYESWTGEGTDEAKEAQDKARQAYEDAKSLFIQSKDKLQCEIEYLGGKMSKEEYDTKSKLHQAYEKGKEAVGNIADKIEEGVDTIKDKITRGKGQNTATHYQEDLAEERHNAGQRRETVPVDAKVIIKEDNNN